VFLSVCRRNLSSARLGWDVFPANQLFIKKSAGRVFEVSGHRPLFYFVPHTPPRPQTYVLPREQERCLQASTHFFASCRRREAATGGGREALCDSQYDAIKAKVLEETYEELGQERLAEG
jgi:hypothetical protein